MQPKCPTRLELHRLKYHQNGGGELLLLGELDDEERELVSHDVLTAIQREAGVDEYEIYSRTLADWGVMCPHPQVKRLYEGKQRLDVPAGLLGMFKWYFCECCKTYVLNKPITFFEKIASGG
jgi:hypothetical protein